MLGTRSRESMCRRADEMVPIVRRLVLAVLFVLVVSPAYGGEGRATLSNDQILHDFIRVAIRQKNESSSDGRLSKWRIPIRIGVIGDSGDRYRERIGEQFQLLSDVTGHTITLVNQANTEVTPSLLQSIENRDVNLIVLMTDLDWPAAFIRYGPLFTFFHPDPENLQAVKRNVKGGCFLDVRGLPQNNELIVGYIVVSTTQSNRTIRRCLSAEAALAMGFQNAGAEIKFSALTTTSDQYVELTQQDKLLLRILYDKRMVAGMGKDQVERLGLQIVQDQRRVIDR
jgi:hypothetical protein